MKNNALTLMAGLTLATAVQAGSDYSAKGQEVTPSPAAPCHWTWFAGGSIGYLTEANEEMYTLHAGAEYRSRANNNISHALYLEVGFTNLEDSGFRSLAGPRSGEFETDVDIIPLTLNYKFEDALTDRINWFAGVGAGVAFSDADVKLTRRNGSVNKDSEDDTVYFGHIFAGLTYDVNDSFEIFLGARYIFMEDTNFNINLGGGNPANNAASDVLRGGSDINDDVLIELGARFNF